VDVDAVRDLDAHDLAAEIPAGANERARDAAVLQDARRAVDVAEEEVEGDHPLREPPLEAPTRSAGLP